MCAEFLDTNQTYDPNGHSKVVVYHMDIWCIFSQSENDWYDITLNIDIPDSIKYEFAPEIARYAYNVPSQVRMMLYPNESILAGTYTLRLYAYALSNNGSYRGQPLGDLTLEVLRDRSVSVEFAGGNIVPYYPDIPQITHNLLLINEGNTVELVFCRYASNGEEINISAYDKLRVGSNNEITLLNPVTIAPGEYVVLDIVFFIDGLSDEDGTIPITIDIISSEDGQVLDERNSTVHKLPEKNDIDTKPRITSNPFLWVIIILIVVIICLGYWGWMSKVNR